MYHFAGFPAQASDSMYVGIPPRRRHGRFATNQSIFNIIERKSTLTWSLLRLIGLSYSTSHRKRRHGPVRRLGLGKPWCFGAAGICLKPTPVPRQISVTSITAQRVWKRSRAKDATPWPTLRREYGPKVGSGSVAILLGPCHSPRRRESRQHQSGLSTWIPAMSGMTGDKTG